jgi:hypothetical protein
MNEQEFRDHYRSSQEIIVISENMKQSILKNAQSKAGAKTSSHTLAAKALHGRANDKERSRMNHKVRFSSLHLVLTAAACLLLVVLAVNLASVWGNKSEETPQSEKPDLGFTIKAYAAETSMVLENNNKDRVIFDKTADDIINAISLSSKEHYLTTEGYYTGCLFQIEGENIARIQASISTGVIYRYHTERITRGENPDLWTEFISWKPTTRGIGKYLGGYDEARILGGLDDGIPKDSPDKQMTVAYIKRLGATIDVPVNAGLSEYSYGFWTNEDFGDISGTPAGGSATFPAVDAIIDLYEGATLTLTVTYTDGRISTQIIELHSAYVKSHMEPDEFGNMMTVLSTEEVDPKTTELKRFIGYSHVLYGTVIKTNEEPFPRSLDRANELEFVVGAPMSFSSKPMNFDSTGSSFELVRVMSEIPLNPQNIHSPVDTLQIKLSDNRDPYSISNLKATTSKTLPDGLTLDNLWHGLGSWEYANRVTSQLDGYTIDDNGTPFEGFTWVMFKADLTNVSNSTKECWPDGGFYGNIAVQDSKGQACQVVCRSFVILNERGATGPAYNVFGPNETKTVRWLLVVPDFALEDPTLFFSVYHGVEPVEGFTLNL